ncbi:hypothetical protein QQF64_036106 [Cirrhinus molitorella]|uniref:LRAT domain-containing protein n=1 Tax=Cirrhinus molitorella TaxID=172907 RepID=A0ABR3NHN7_9TELE
MASKKGTNIPEAGDMVEFPRSLGYSHYGISDGKGNLIHATSDTNSSGSVVKKEPLDKVAPGGNFKVNNQNHGNKPLSPETIVSRAEKRIGNPVEYRLLTNNCETFASEMRYGDGKGCTQQGENFIKGATKAGQSFLSNAVETHNHFEGK